MTTSLMLWRQIQIHFHFNIEGEFSLQIKKITSTIKSAANNVEIMRTLRYSFFLFLLFYLGMGGGGAFRGGITRDRVICSAHLTLQLCSRAACSSLHTFHTTGPTLQRLDLSLRLQPVCVLVVERQNIADQATPLSLDVIVCIFRVVQATASSHLHCYDFHQLLERYKDAFGSFINPQCDLIFQFINSRHHETSDSFTPIPIIEFVVRARPGLRFGAGPPTKSHYLAFAVSISLQTLESAQTQVDILSNISSSNYISTLVSWRMNQS